MTSLLIHGPYALLEGQQGFVNLCSLQFSLLNIHLSVLGSLRASQVSNNHCAQRLLCLIKCLDKTKSMGSARGVVVDSRVGGPLAKGELYPVDHLLQIISLYLGEILDHHISRVILENLHLFFLVEKILALSRVNLEKAQQEVVTLVAHISGLEEQFNGLVQYSLHCVSFARSCLTIGKYSYVVTKEQTSN